MSVRQFANSSHSSFCLAIFMLQPEKEIINPILNQKLHNASDFDIKILQRIRL